MAAQGDVGSMAEQGDLSGSMAKQGDLSGPIAEQGDVSGPIAEQGDVSGPIPEQGDVSGPIAEQGDVSGPISEQGDVSGPIPEQGDVSGPIPEQSDVSGPIAEQGDVSGPIPELGDVSGPIAEQGDVSGLHSDVVDVGEGDDEKETWPGFKLVGDNIDKTIKPRDMRINNQANSVHYFNVYAVRDRINFSHLSSNAGMISPEDIKFDAYYPSSDDDNKLLLNFEILVTRILVKHLPGMEKLSNKVTDLISHKYSSNMTQKSKVVCSHTYVVPNSTFVIVSLLM